VTSPMELEVVERLNLLLDRMIRQAERIDAVISDLETRKDELQQSNRKESK
jgi:hypothetical protein